MGRFNSRARLARRFRMEAGALDDGRLMVHAMACAGIWTRGGTHTAAASTRLKQCRCRGIQQCPPINRERNTRAGTEVCRRNSWRSLVIKTSWCRSLPASALPMPTPIATVPCLLS